MSQERAERKRIVFYDDAYVFGGHELLLFEFLRYLNSHPELAEVTLLLSRENEIHLNRYNFCLGNAFKVELLPFATPRRLGNLASIFALPRILHVARRLRAIRPHAVLVAQGGIDTSTNGLLAARLCGLRTLSYIPILNGYYRNNPTLKNRVRDLVNRPFFRLPHEFVVIRRQNELDLREWGFRGKVHVVFNAMDPSRLKHTPKAEARQALGLPAEGYLMGQVGRLMLSVKRQDFVVRAMRNHPGKFSDAYFVVVGEGDGEKALLEMAQDPESQGKVFHIPFRSDLSLVYSALDVLLIPSLSEGVPLVMLEAWHYGLPVVASALDGMAELLPPEWLFEPYDERDFVETISTVRLDPGVHRITANQHRLEADFSFVSFFRGFSTALDLPADRGHHSAEPT
jgi:glycosyltransferase involved in cell wall biosynthesis